MPQVDEELQRKARAEMSKASLYRTTKPPVDLATLQVHMFCASFRQKFIKLADRHGDVAVGVQTNRLAIFSIKHAYRIIQLCTGEMLELYSDGPGMIICATKKLGEVQPVVSGVFRFLKTEYTWIAGNRKLSLIQSAISRLRLNFSNANGIENHYVSGWSEPIFRKLPLAQDNDPELAIVALPMLFCLISLIHGSGCD